MYLKYTIFNKPIFNITIMVQWLTHNTSLVSLLEESEFLN